MLTVRYFAGARAAAGVTEEQVPADRLATPTIADLVETLTAWHGPNLAKVLGVASFLVDGLPWHDRTAQVPAGATVDVLPPFAGG